jgi:CSLREA domain-containing protein
MKRFVLLSALAAVMAVVLASPAQAATLTVNTLADEQNNNGSCSLREAIINANENNQTGSTDCGAGSGNDTITFTVSGQITLNSSLPPITDPAGLTISNPIGPITEAVTISGNNATTMFFIEEAELTLDNLILSDVSSGQGAIVSDGTLTVTNSIVSGNSEGFAIDNTGTLTVTNSIFSGNSGGGAIGNRGTLTVTKSTFSGNSNDATGGAAQGGAISSDGTANVTSSTFTGNSTRGFGGAIHNLGGGSLTVNNSTFSGNTAPDGRGGGIYCDTGSFAGTHDTFTNNSGGNIVLENCSVGLSNTILANDNQQGSNCSDPITDGGYNISDDASCAFSASTSKNSTNPRLHPQGLRDNGGPTHTIALLPNSPAIDAIPRATNGCGTDVQTDQRDISRPQGPACDIGAFEVQKRATEDKQACKKGGHEKFGFKNQGRCIKAVNAKN